MSRRRRGDLPPVLFWWGRILMKHEADFPGGVLEHADMGIIMPDGCRLSAHVWMPEDAAEKPVPAILEHLPYRKRDGTIVRDQFNHS